jgi:hypothetical protein
LAAVCSRKEPCLVHPQFVDQSDFHVDRLFLGGFRRGLDGNISVAVAVAVSARRLRTDADCRRATSRRTPALATTPLPLVGLNDFMSRIGMRCGRSEPPSHPVLSGHQPNGHGSVERGLFMSSQLRPCQISR